MGSLADEFIASSEQEQLNEDEEFFKVMEFTGTAIVHTVFRASVELDLFQIIAKAGPNAYLSTSEIASHLPTHNQEAPTMLDRMLRLLASYSILKCSLVTNQDGHPTRLYGLTSMCQYLISNQDGISVAPSFLLFQDRVLANSWYHLKDAVLEGGTPFNKAYGMELFEYMGKDSRFSESFNQALVSQSTRSMRRILETYKGFEGVSQVVDVGGGLGATLRSIVSKYPKIRGINFDLPLVIAQAPTFPGVEHVGGDMFEGVPKGEVILLKNILHDWGDEQCLKILKNCWEALPESGKLIVIEIVLSEFPKTDYKSKTGFQYDIGILTATPGRERTVKEFEALAMAAGFRASILVCSADLYGILEFCKKI